jgi:hypothetical protein
VEDLAKRAAIQVAFAREFPGESDGSDEINPTGEKSWGVALQIWQRRERRFSK